MVEKSGFDKGGEEEMSELVARTGRHQQRYDHGCRLVAGCIPFRYRSSSQSDGAESEKDIEVLMINSTSGPGLLFPKGGWENDETVEEAARREAIEEAGVKGDLLLANAIFIMGNLETSVFNTRKKGHLGYYKFKSKTLEDEFSREGLCKASMFALLVKEELEHWPEQSTRERKWLTIPEARGCCRHPWMREALEDGFMKWYEYCTPDGKEGSITSPTHDRSKMAKCSSALVGDIY